MFFDNLICSILEALAGAFGGSPFFGFVAGILNALLDAFDCVISG